HVLNAAELVELHVRVDLPARPAIHDDLLEQGIVHAHDDAAGHLRLAAQLVDHHAAVLDGDDLGAADDAGLGVHLDLCDLHAADAVIGHVSWDRRFCLALGGVHAEAGAGLLPRPTPLVRFIDDLAGFYGQILLLGAQLARQLAEEIVASSHGSVVRQRRRAWAGGAAA